jgi:hypothetical protein
MPFKRRNARLFAWEEQAARGEEFVATVSVRTLCHYPTRILRSANASGVFVVRRHKTVLAVIGSPRILFNVLTQRKDGHALIHPGIHPEIERIALNALTHSQAVQPLTTITWSVRRFLENVQRPTFFDPLNVNGVVVAVLRRTRLYALMIPISVLTRVWRETESPNSQRAEWVDEVIEFTRQVSGISANVHTDHP